MPTYNRHYSFAYSLIRDARDVDDFNSITREQLGRSNFSRDQAIAANQANFDRATMLREAARDNSRLRNLHPQMGNTSDTGGFGGGGYATGRDDVATQDYGLPSDGNGITCLIELDKLSGSVDDFILLSQAICKPDIAIYGRYVEKQGNGIFLHTTADNDDDETVYVTTQSHGPVHENVYTDGRGNPSQRYPTTRVINRITPLSFDSTTTTLEIRNTAARDGLMEITLDVSINPDVTYWFIRVYDKRTAEEVLIHVPQVDCIQRYFGKEVVTNNYPNVALGRSMVYDQTHFDQYKGDIEEYPLTEEREAYDAEHADEIEELDESLVDLQVELDAAMAGQDAAFVDLTEMSDDEQDYLTDKYFNTVIPAMYDLGLDPATYTQAQLDALGDSALASWNTALVGYAPDVTPEWELQRAALGYTLDWLDLVNRVSAAINDFVSLPTPPDVLIYWEVVDAAGVTHISERATGPITEPNFASMTYTEAVSLGIIEPTDDLVEVSSTLIFAAEAAAYYLVTLLDPAPNNVEDMGDRYDTYTYTMGRISVIESAQDGMLVAIPDQDPIDVMHTFAAALPWMYEEERIVGEMNTVKERKLEIAVGAPQTEFTSNQFYSEWGEWTFFKDYRPKFGDMYETFMSEGFPQHAEARRFISMIGQKPRTISDLVRSTAQDKPEGGGDAMTLSDQLTLGCQITANADYAEMRYFVEFARSAWWHTPFSEVSTLTAHENVIAQSDLGQSAWGISSVEENMVNPIESTLGPTRTRWGTVEVWIEEGQVDYGQFGHIALSQLVAEDTDEVSRHANGKWTGYSSNEQEVIATYNIAEGLVLKARMTQLSTIFYTELTGAGGKWGGANSLDYPILPLFYNVLAGIPQQQVCQIAGDFIFIRSHTYWTQHRSSWVKFRDGVLYKIVGFVLTIIGFVLSIPSGGASLTLVGVGTALMYAAIYYAAMRIIAHYLKQWGLDKTWLGAIIMTAIAIVGMMYGMPPQDALLLGTTMTADAMSYAYEQANLEEAKEHAGLMSSYDTTMEELREDMAQMEEEQHWLDFYSAADLVKMRQDAVDYVRDETPDQYYKRMMDYNDNSLSLDGVDYYLDYTLNLDY